MKSTKVGSLTVAKIPQFNFRLQRTENLPTTFSLEFSILDGGVGLLRLARAGGCPKGEAVPIGSADRLTASQLQRSRFDLTWDNGTRRISYGLFALGQVALEHLITGIWYSLRPQRLDGPRRLELARPEGTFGLSRLDPEDSVIEETVTDDPPSVVPDALEPTPPAVIDDPIDESPVKPMVGERSNANGPGDLVGPTTGALVRHLRRKQARDAKEIIRLRNELKRLHRMLKDAGLAP
jgi:hypothetical protein